MTNGDPKTAATVKIAAGMRNSEILAAAAERNITVVTGADSNVGIGGWITGAGHGPLSSTYGLGADQVLSMEVVTADGRFLHIDKDRHAGLFWAMRGVNEHMLHVQWKTSLLFSRAVAPPSLYSSLLPFVPIPPSPSHNTYSATTQPPTRTHSGTSPPSSTHTYPASLKPAQQATTTPGPWLPLSPTRPNVANCKASSLCPRRHPSKQSASCNPSRPPLITPNGLTKST